MNSETVSDSPHDPTDSDLLRQRLLGAWRLVEGSISNADGEMALRLVNGSLVYDTSGIASAQVGVASDSPDQALLAEIGAWVGYYGPFSVSEASDQVIHHVENSSVAGWIGRDLPRGVRFEGEDTLILSADVSRQFKAMNGSGEVRWQRVASDDRTPAA